MLKWVFIVLLLAWPTSAGSLADLDSKYGFRDIKFGSHIDSLSGFTLEEVSGDKSFYIRKSDSLKIGPAPLKFIGYTFYKGRFLSVMFESKGLENSSRLFEVLSLAYGEPRQPNEFIKEYFWLGKRVSGFYEYSDIHEKGTVFFSSRDIQSEMDADNLRASKKAVSDL